MFRPFADGERGVTSFTTGNQALLLLAVAQSLFLAVLVHFRVHGRDGRILALLLGVFALNAAFDMATGFGQLFWLLPVYFAVLLMIGPLALTYLEAVAQPERQGLSAGLRWHWMLAAATGLALIASLVPWYGTWRDAAAGNIRSDTITPGIGVFLLLAVAIIQATIQQGLCLWAAHRRLAAAKQGLAADSPQDARLSWLELLVRVFLGLWIAFVFTLCGGAFAKWNDAIGFMDTLLYVAAIYGLSGFALLNPEAFRQPREAIEAVAASLSLSKYRKSALTDADVERLLAKLEQEMRRAQAWRDSGLSLAALSRRIGASTNDVSQAINQGTSSGFYDYVNRYRVEDAKALLLDPAEARSTILDVAYQVGFNSKSAFNSAFRKLTGTTPSLFRSRKTSSPIGPNDGDPLQAAG
jgi:AraC-like DNA-binding protein